jgi:tRNA(Arg) A34 adenosine deaminase TadA
LIIRDFRAFKERNFMPGNPVFMQQAIDLATENVHSGRGGPFGAVIVRDGDVVAVGSNLVTASNDPTAHAEVVAIRNACTELNTFALTGCEIYTSCEPCPMCLAAVYWARLGAIYYGNTAADAAAAGFDDAYLYNEIKLPLSQRSIPTINLLRDQALSSFNAWRDYAGRIDY